MIAIMVVSVMLLALGAILVVRGLLDDGSAAFGTGMAILVVFFSAFVLAAIEKDEREWKCTNPEVQLTPDARQQ